jgi:hypothetical protein
MQAFIAIVFDCSVHITFAYNNQKFSAVQILWSKREVLTASCSPSASRSLHFAGKAEPGAERNTGRVGYGYGACGAAFKKE